MYRIEANIDFNHGIVAFGLILIQVLINIEFVFHKVPPGRITGCQSIGSSNRVLVYSLQSQSNSLPSTVTGYWSTVYSLKSQVASLQSTM